MTDESDVACPHCGRTTPIRDYTDGPGEYYLNAECVWCDKLITVNVSYQIDVWIEKGHRESNG
jgi:hypothetical protein